MVKVGVCTVAILEALLDEVFAGEPHGGDHESRKHVARRLLESAEERNATLDDLSTVGRDAFQQLSTRRLA